MIFVKLYLITAIKIAIIQIFLFNFLKLMIILDNFLLITDCSNQKVIFKKVFCIYYLF